MERRLKNFANDINQEEVYKQFIYSDKTQFFNYMVQVDLHPSLRLIVYLRCFNILDLNDIDNWTQQLQKLSKQFNQLTKQYNNFKNIKNLNQADPLLQYQKKEDDIYYQKYVILNLEKLIQLDINRLFSNIDFFVNQQNRSIIHRITALLCHFANNDIYKQGMHEIVGIIYYIVIQGVTNLTFVKHFNLDYLQHLKYITETNAEMITYFLAHGIFVQLQLLKLYNEDELLTQLINNVNTQLLQKTDHALYERLQQLSIESIYLVRFYRLFFCREVQYQFVPRVWDFIFNHFYNQFVQKETNTQYNYFSNNFLDYITLAVYTNKKQLILSQDYNYLMKYFSGSVLSDLKSISEVEQVMNQAVYLYNSINNVEQSNNSQEQLDNSQSKNLNQNVSKQKFFNIYLIQQLNQLQKSVRNNQQQQMVLDQIDNLISLLNSTMDEELFQDLLKQCSIDDFSQFENQNAVEYIMEQLLKNK